MSDFQIQDGQIFVHKNAKQEGKQPSHKGSLMIDGVEYELALWPSKSGKDGSFSGKVKVKQQRVETGDHGQPMQDVDGDAIPF